VIDVIYKQSLDIDLQAHIHLLLILIMTQERSLLLCLEVGDKMDQTLASPVQDVLRNTPASQLPQRLAAFTAAWSSADYVTTALSLVSRLLDRIFFAFIRLPFPGRCRGMDTLTKSKH
jgi:hypothetical protein